MPKEFVQVVKQGGKVITKRLSGNRYIHFVKKNGKWIPGEVKRRKSDATG